MMTYKGHGLGRSSLHAAAGYGRVQEVIELLKVKEGGREGGIEREREREIAILLYSIYTIMLYILYTVHCTVYSVQCTVYTVHYK